jgi:NADH:ubiquinone oxidoreductase subunit E
VTSVPRPERREPAHAQLDPVGPARPTAVPGWDRPADLSKAPGTVPELAETDVAPDLRAEIEHRMSLYPDRHSAVLPALHAAQKLYGWLPPQAIDEVAAVMKVTPAYLSSIASFYDMLNERPVGRHSVYVCTSVSCSLSDAKKVYGAILDEAERTGLEDTEVREFACLGACDMQPMASIDGRYVGPLDVSDAAEIVASIREGRRPLPGRGLEDEDFRLPYEAAEAAPGGTPEHEAGPTDRGLGPSHYPDETPEAKATEGRNRRRRGE